MGIFDLFKKDKKEDKKVYGPIKCMIGDFLNIERRLVSENVFLDVIVLKYKDEVHRVGNMFRDGNIIVREADNEPAYIFDKDKYNSLEELIQSTFLKYEADYIELLGYGSDEFDDAINSIQEDDFYLDGNGEYWKLCEK